MTEPQPNPTADLVVWLRQQLDADEQHAHAIGNVLRTRPATAPLAGWLLRDVAAKRSLIDALVRFQVALDLEGCVHSAEEIEAGQCPTAEWSEGHYNRAMKALGSAYADRDGYLEEWRPTQERGDAL